MGARGHVFEKAFGGPCVVEPCGPGELKEPDGVAVNEATGHVYVVDKKQFVSPALAAAPEAPETKTANEVTATTAMLHGVLNPKAVGEPGFYEFVYRVSTSKECEGDGRSPQKNRHGAG